MSVNARNWEVVGFCEQCRQVGPQIYFCVRPRIVVNAACPVAAVHGVARSLCDDTNGRWASLELGARPSW
jgi:hypothetical protein